MRLSSAAALAALLCACAPGPAGDHAPAPTWQEVRAASLRATLKAWQDAGLPVGAECRPASLSVERWPAAAVAMCGDPVPGAVAQGCFVAPNFVVVSDALDAYHAADVLTHELLHWLLFCTYGNADPAHVARPAFVCVWGDDVGCVIVNAWAGLLF